MSTDGAFEVRATDPDVAFACARSIAMKRNPVTGKLEEFHSRALQDDLPDEEAETAEVELPVGDDY